MSRHEGPGGTSRALAGTLAATREASRAPSVALTPAQSAALVRLTHAWNESRAARHLRRLSLDDVLTRVLENTAAELERGLGG